MSETNHTTLGVTGMTCAACSNRVEKVLNKMDGVKAQVNLTTEKASIDYDPEKTSIEDILKKIENVGYGVLTEKTDLDVFGMTCAACSTRIEKVRSEEHTSELQSRGHLVCRLLLEKTKRGDRSIGWTWLVL